MRPPLRQTENGLQRLSPHRIAAKRDLDGCPVRRYRSTATRQPATATHLTAGTAQRCTVGRLPAARWRGVHTSPASQMQPDVYRRTCQPLERRQATRIGGCLVIAANHGTVRRAYLASSKRRGTHNTKANCQNWTKALRRGRDEATRLLRQFDRWRAVLQATGA